MEIYLEKLNMDIGSQRVGNRTPRKSVQRRCSLVSTVKPRALTTISLMATELVKASDFSVDLFLCLLYFYFICYREVKSHREGRSSRLIT